MLQRPGSSFVLWKVLLIRQGKEIFNNETQTQHKQDRLKCERLWGQLLSFFCIIQEEEKKWKLYFSISVFSWTIWKSKMTISLSFVILPRLQNHSIHPQLPRRKHQVTFGELSGNFEHVGPPLLSFQGDVRPPLLLVHLGHVQPARGCVQQRERAAHPRRTGWGAQLSFIWPTYNSKIL